MQCRSGCGACCIAPSISSPIPGMPNGKPAGVKCPSLTDDYLCRIWGTDAFPDVCRRFRPDPFVCGEDREDATQRLERSSGRRPPRCPSTFWPKKYRV